MPTEKLAMPLVNLNGSSPQDLLDQLTEACLAVSAAREAVANAAPHGRDYQLNQGDYQLAREQHEARLVALKAINDELEAIAENVADQQAARQRQRGR
jgi:hypothetical protein